MKNYINIQNQESVKAIQFTDKDKNTVRHYVKPKFGGFNEKNEPYLETYIDDNWNFQTLYLSNWFVKKEGELYGFVLSNEDFEKTYKLNE